MNSRKFLTLQKLVLTFLLLIHIGCSWFISEQTMENIELKISHYPNESVEYESEHRNGNLHGITKYWDESENLISEAIYSNGKLHGIWTSYFADGIVQSKVNYYYGHKHGKEEFYYNNGQLQSLTEYNEGEVIFETIRWTRAGGLIP